MTRFGKRVWRVLAFFTAVLAVVLIFFAISGAGPALPNPNGYGDFVKAGQMLTSRLDDIDLSDYRELDIKALKALANANAEALETARTGLQYESRVPVEKNQDWFRVHLEESSSFIRLTRAFCLAGRLAELERRTNDAVKIYLDAVRFVHASARGGLDTDAMVRWVREALVMAELNRLRDSLDADQNRRVVATLEQIEVDRETWREFRWRGLMYALRAETRSLLSPANWRTRERNRGRFHQAENKRRQAMIAFAARAYELDNGKKPENVTELVSNYLKAIPQDSLTGKPLDLGP